MIPWAVFQEGSKPQNVAAQGGYTAVLADYESVAARNASHGPGVGRPLGKP